MALRAFVEGECNRRNRINRQVAEMVSFPEETFWRQCRSGDFLISGGSLLNRSNAVLSYVQTVLSREEKTLVILDGTGALERDLIALFTGRGGLGRLQVFSPTYPGYDVFGGMSLYEVLAYLTDVTRDRPRGSEISTAYLEAFLHVLKGACPLTLFGMRQLSDKTDEEIVTIARNIRAPAQYISALTNQSAEGVHFRAFLRELEYAFSRIRTARTAPGNSVLRHIRGRGVLYINAQSPNLHLFNRYFLRVFDYIGTSLFCPFDVILYGVNVYRSDGLEQHLMTAMQSATENIGLCYSNIAPMLQQCPFLADIPRQILYTGGAAQPPRELLHSYGTYEYAYPQRMYAHGLFSNPLENGWQIGVATRDRVRPADLAERPVGKIMKGHRGEEIALVRGI